MYSGQAINPYYDDRYFSDSEGLQESTHVFIEGNRLVQRITRTTNDRESGTDDTFHIAETGFGTGLNVLALAYAIAARPARPIVWWSVEAHPLSTARIRELLSPFPEITYLVDPLCNALDRSSIPNHEGWVDVPVFFAPGGPDMELRLFVGDVQDYMAGLAIRLGASGGSESRAGGFGGAGSTMIDAWLPDGHSPDKNPGMWSPGVFTGMASVSRSGVTSFATFTAAGLVKRGLRGAGFLVTRSAGFGRKRHMIRGTYQG